ncbi:MAG: hypothetical protein LBU60_06380 [Clostridiales bacterium]|jgi:hypothetical protein|nr:hypothetical protein [Clostridiales bacterium]
MGIIHDEANTKLYVYNKKGEQIYIPLFDDEFLDDEDTNIKEDENDD